MFTVHEVFGLSCSKWDNFVVILLLGVNFLLGVPYIRSIIRWGTLQQDQNYESRFLAQLAAGLLMVPGGMILAIFAI